MGIPWREGEARGGVAEAQGDRRLAGSPRPAVRSRGRGRSAATGEVLVESMLYVVRFGVTLDVASIFQCLSGF